MRNFFRLLAVIGLFAIVAVGAWHSLPASSSRPVPASTHRQVATTTPIKHVVVIMMENHSFDNMFGTFPGANGSSNLPRASNPILTDLNHDDPSTRSDIDGGAMDGFSSHAYVGYTQADIPNYWAYAKHFGLGDNFFSSIESSSTPNHVSMIAAQSGGIDVTVGAPGCGSILTSILHLKNITGNQYLAYPCYAINSLPHLLDANNLSLKYYAVTTSWDSPLLIKNLYGSPN